MEVIPIQKFLNINPQSAIRNLQFDEWQWIDFLCEDAQSTMKRDRKFFDEVKKNGSAPILRFYSWKEPTLSYGKTQGIEPETFSKCINEGWKIVQRPTGGGKVFHKNDLCFSIIWRKKDSTIPWGIKDSYCAIHWWVRESLDELGIKTDFENRDCFANTRNDKKRGWCFQSPLENDLLCDGKKIVGGAQWRDGKVALHQGSIQIPPDNLDLEIFKQKFCEMFRVTFLQLC